MDKLNDIVEQQKTLMDRLGIITHERSDTEAQRETKDLLFAICCELGETGDEINWKPWKRTIKPINLKLLRTELIDIFHFIMELMIIWGMDAEMIYLAYCDKMKENNARQDRGY
jgi:dimeric dUTPase (all-alpha-NTP-PPase superfamily)